jgi:hypothetical protein
MSSERFVSATRLFEPALTLDLRLLLHALDLRIGDLACVREDVSRISLRLGDELTVLLEELAGLLPGLVGLVDSRTNAIAPLVDRLLDRAESEPLEDEKRDPERDERPDHEPRDDFDQARCEEVRHP